MDIHREFEYIVVGAGTAGCVVAARLAEAGCRILLIEAGQDLSSNDQDPKLGKIAPSDDWGIFAETSSDRDPMWLPRGRRVGGTSLLQGGIALTAPMSDYTIWAAKVGWEPSIIASAFARLVHDSDFGPQSPRSDALHVERTRPFELQPIHSALAQSCAVAGIPWRENLNDFVGHGVGLTPAARRQGEPQHVSNTVLARVRNHSGLSILSCTTVRRLRMGGGKIRSISVTSDGAEAEIPCSGRLVLCGGAIGTPDLLLQSGIGPPQTLLRAGLQAIHPLDAVGATLRDHPSLHIGFQLEQGRGKPGLPWFSLMLRDIAGLRTRHRGAGYAVEIFHDFVLAPSPTAYDRAIVTCTLLDATGSGTVVPRADSLPSVRLGFDHSADQASLRLALLETCSLLESSQFGLVGHKGLHLLQSRSRRDRMTGSAVRLDSELRDKKKALIPLTLSAHHLHGSCPMGRIPDHAVVDPNFKVFGIDNLFLADASVIPVQLRANTHLTTMIIGELAAQAMLGESSRFAEDSLDHLA